MKFTAVRNLTPLERLMQRTTKAGYGQLRPEVSL